MQQWNHDDQDYAIVFGIFVVAHMLSWWRHDTEKLSVLLVLCEGNPATTVALIW